MSIQTQRKNIHLPNENIFSLRSDQRHFAFKSFIRFGMILFTIYLFPSSAISQTVTRRDDRKIDITFLQLNDVYEISPLDHGKIGGMARVATIRKELQLQNKNTYTLLAGDFLSPSAIATIRDSTKKSIAGMHMLETLNQVGINLVTFGNHEFDIKKAQLEEAINRSSFDWISSNVYYLDSIKSFKRFSKTVNSVIAEIPTTKILSFRDGDGTKVQIGIIGLTIKTPDRYESYEDYYTAAGNAIVQLKGKCDFIIALTHLSLYMDKELARRFPEIKLIIGGHEHINSYDTVGSTIIAKADANAKSAYIHYLHYERRSAKLSIRSRLMVINNAIEEDSSTRAVVDKWNSMAHSLLMRQGSNPCEIIDSLEQPMDGTEENIRTKQTNLTEFIGEALMEAIDGPPADCSIFNGGGIRIDDMLSGYVTRYDIFRVLPFENKIAIKKLSGHLLDSLLRTNNTRKKDGSFLQFYGIKTIKDSFYIHDLPLMMDTLYTVVMNEYLAKGDQVPLKVIGTTGPVYTMAPLKKELLANDMKEAMILKFRNRHASPVSWPKTGLKVPCY